MHTTRNLVSSLVLGSLLAVAPSAGAMKATPSAPPPLPPVPAAFVESNDAFASDLYQRLAKDPGNVFFSPASVSTALAMTYAGAKGDTAKEMAKTLHFDLASKDLHEAFGSLLRRLDSPGGKDPELRVANRLFGQDGMPLEKPFTDLTKDRYQADLGVVDFVKATEAARKTINLWVEGKTNAKIKDLLREGSLTSDTRLVLANAIYFKGNWVSKFDKKETKDDPFTLSPGKTKKTPMMHQTLDAPYAETGDAQVLTLPYQSATADHAMSMVIVLPKSVDGLSKIEGAMTGKQLASWAKQGSSSHVVVSMPKFKTTYTSEMGETLKKMGMPAAFDGAKADFSGMTKAAHLHIDRVVHKAFVDVNEEGTEAAAATAVVMADEGAAVPLPPKTFKADHPFLFMIRDDKTGSILFLGRVADPG